MSRPAVAILAVLATTISAVTLRAEVDVEAGRYAINSYSSKSYGASPQNWAITGDKRGLMYFGNTDGVLEFDGITWRKIPIPNGTARVLARDAKGTIYVGGDGTLGYLRPGRDGMQFVSLVDRIPAADRQFGIVLNALSAPDGIYFSSRNRLFRFRDDGGVDVWSVDGGFRRALFRASGLIYLSTFKAGPMTLERGQLVASPWSKSFSRPLVGVIPWSRTVILASSDRLYRMEGDEVQPFPTQADEYLSQHRISLLDTLPNGDLVIGTASGGIVVLADEGHSVRLLTQTSGLPSNSITGFFVDSRENAWVATNAGLAHFVPSLTYFSEGQGIKGNVYSVGRQDGNLYAGSTAGLYRLHTSTSGEPAFETVKPVISAVTVWTIARAGDISLAGADDGLYSISGQDVKKVISSATIFDLHPAQHDPNLVFTAGRDGVSALRREGATWKVVAQAKGNGHDFRTVAEDADGRLWATTRIDVWRFDMRSDPVRAERFDRANGVPDGWKNAYRFRNHVVFATGKGLLRFSEEKRRFQPDSELGTQFADGSKPVSIVREDDLHHVWISGKGYHGFLRLDTRSEPEWMEMPLVASGIEEAWCLNVDPDGTVWAAGEEGMLFRWKPNATAQFNGQEFRVLIREMNVAESKTALFAGSGPPPSPLKIPFRQNALRFEFAAPFFEAPSTVEYQFRLDDNDRDWSPWTRESHKDFTNLPPHNFRFRVKARNPYGAVSPEATLSFRVLPPWYRTWWCYCLYVLGAVLLSWTLFRWRLKVLRAHNQHLERIVEQRTIEVRTQRDQNEALLLNILPAPIASELRDNGSVTPSIFEDVTVCFTDFVGFTLSSETLSADKLVTALNEYFTAFDAIMARYGLEKLKTIGDSYMFVSGLPEPRPSHAVDAVLAGLEMLHTARIVAKSDRETDWKMRVGLYSGPVVAGVVGRSKFAFDIWGNTVNLASRMESSGAPDRVNLSASTCAHVHEFIHCEPRGRVRIKEGRELEMHFALGIKPELLQGPLMDGVPAAFRDRYQATFGRIPRAFPAFLVQPKAELLMGASGD